MMQVDPGVCDIMQVDPGVETALGADDAMDVGKASKLAKGLYNTPQELKNHLAENGISADMLAFVGLDPGKHNIISATLVEEFVQKQLAKTPLLQRKAHSVSYTQGQREKETGAEHAGGKQL